MNPNPGLFLFRKNLRLRNRGNFRVTSHECFHFIAQGFFKLRGDSCFERVAVRDFAVEKNIAAGDEGFHFIESHLFEQLPEPAHGQTPFAQIDSAQKSNVPVHGLFFAAGEHGLKIRRLFLASHDADFDFLESRGFEPTMQIAFGESEPAVAV